MGDSLITAVPALTILAALVATERGVGRCLFAASVVVTVTALIALVTGDIERATALASLLTLAVIGASMVKFHHSARVLIAADLPLAFAGTVPFFFAQYRRMTIGLCAGGAALLGIAIGICLRGGGIPLDPINRFVFLAISGVLCAAAVRANGGVRAFRASVVQPGGYVSTFAASLIDIQARWPSRRLNLVALADAPWPLQP